MAQPENVRSSAEFLALDDQTLLSQCDIDTYRASGPGGQKRNKTSSAVRLRHGPTASIVTASEDRSQHVNKARALRRLREAIALTVRAPIDAAAYVPSGLLATCISASGRLGPRRLP
ncbi:MAG: peptide chain release factor family protein [Phycisphaerae bacterium]